MELRIVLREQDWVDCGDEPSPPDGVSIRGPVPIEKYQTMDSDSVALLGIVIHYGPDIVVGVLSAWIYDLLKKRGPKRVSIDRQQIDVCRGEIEKIIREKIRTCDQ